MTTHDIDTNPTTTKTTTATDVIVVGGGIAGLVAAITAARDGARVVLLEARSPGGRARTTIRDGFGLNEGPHALYDSGPAVPLLRRLGVTITGRAPDLAGTMTWWDGERVALPSTVPSMLRTTLLGVRGKLAAGRLAPVLRRGDAPDTDGRSFVEWLDDRRVPADLSRLLAVYARTATYTADLDALAAGAGLRQLAYAAAGVTYVDGGWQRIVDDLLRAAEAAAATIHTGAPVTTLDRERDDWVATAGDAHVAAPAVVIAAGGPGLATRLSGRDPGWIERCGAASEAAVLDLGLRHDPRVSVLLSADDPLYGSVHSLPGSGLAPAGTTLVSVLRYLGTTDRPGHERTRAELDRHATRMGIGSDDVLVERFMAAMTVTWTVPRPGQEPLRGDEVAGEGIWVAGDWVSEHMLTDAAVVSGVRAGHAAAARVRAAA